MARHLTEYHVLKIFHKKRYTFFGKPIYEIRGLYQLKRITSWGFEEVIKEWWETIESYETLKEAEGRLEELEDQHIPTIMRFAKNSTVDQVLKAYEKGGDWVYVEHHNGKKYKVWSQPLFKK